ncbi:MAG: hypothetical protein GY797_38285 [Deltaproteobacteria bacterium]|nr:hypothetical protein [Deltaproteobacteria bacterium]
MLIDSDHKKSTLKKFGIPEKFGVLLLTLTLGLSLSPYFPGQEFVVFTVPNFNALYSNIFKVLGPLLFFISFFSMLPVWKIKNQADNELENKGIAESPYGKPKVKESGPTISKITFRDYLYPDSVSIKLAIDKYFEEDAVPFVLWPSDFDDLLKSVETMQSNLLDYRKKSSLFFGFGEENVIDLIDRTKHSIDYAYLIRKSISKRIPLMLDGMVEYLGRGHIYIEPAIKNFITLANFWAQYGLARSVDLKPPFDRFFPSQWKTWVREGDRDRGLQRLLMANMAKLFNFDKPVYEAYISKISDYEFGPAYYWGPKDLIIRSRDNIIKSGAIINKWYSIYLVPQFELGHLIYNDPDRFIVYDETAIIEEIRDENGERVYGKGF